MNVNDQQRIGSVQRHEVDQAIHECNSQIGSIVEVASESDQGFSFFPNEEELVSQEHGQAPKNSYFRGEYLFVDCTPASIFDKKQYHSVIKTNNRTSIKLGEFRRTGMFTFKAGIFKVPNHHQDLNESLSEVASILLSLDCYGCIG